MLALLDARALALRMDGRELIAALGLRPHPEGGHYAETLRVPSADGGRALVTAIHFVLLAGERSRWHRVDATEIWLFHAGDPLLLEIDGRAPVRLGSEVLAGEVVQATVPAGAWQQARPLGAWTLVSCVVAPGFEFSGFELAPEGWSPG